MLVMNKISNKNFVDNSYIRFNSEGCINLPNKLCPIRYSDDLQVSWVQNPPNIVDYDRKTLFGKICKFMNELPKNRKVQVVIIILSVPAH
jgi:hypothetical protein